VRHDYITTQDVKPAKPEPAQDNVAPVSRRERTRQWAAERRANAERLAERAQAERGRHRSVDAVFEMADRDSEVGGGIIAGALAYRLFIWLLPLALVAVAGLGIAARRLLRIARTGGGITGPARVDLELDLERRG
jgi:hypothetical protein